MLKNAINPKKTKIEKNNDIDERIIPIRDKVLFSSFLLPTIPQINPTVPKTNPKKNRPTIPKTIDRIPSKFDWSFFIFSVDIN